MLEIENASLAEVHAHTEIMNANIAELIMGFDDITSAFSRDFDEMSNKTGWESLVGQFSAAKSDSMRQDSVRTVGIDDELQDLIGKSDIILQLLEGQLAVLDEHKTKVGTTLSETLDERDFTVGELEALRVAIQAIDPEIITLENKSANETDKEAQTAIAGIGAATNTKMADMLEAHEGHMVFARDVLESRADERFARRFAQIIETHDKSLYGS
ncbi:hypothetical protein ROG8370_02234 [Roseovarius gaetbuli]|uniref:Uncharacterized protein n=1 Tax=Roseovarius gaetbuli TaxID=1356575 RepID=A0A1X6ZFV1_9RHOB|nr:hypothetical protein [Roseovarius gaetbuli]SLN50558.1 hypothetical protein ROG8370_02234 [Roseovarius gaetbuli]